jgi:hypothetical protein
LGLVVRRLILYNLLIGVAGLAAGCWFVYEAFAAVRSGVVKWRSTAYYRSERPVRFWATVVSYAAFAMFVAGFAVYRLAALLRGEPRL